MAGTTAGRSARGAPPAGAPAGARVTASPAGMLVRLPSMEAAQLTVLQENAERLARDGTRPQKAAAQELLPAIEAELADRQAAKLAAAKERAAEATRKRTAKRKPAAAAAEPTS